MYSTMESSVLFLTLKCSNLHKAGYIGQKSGEYSICQRMKY